jgi:hypothetical protein
LCAAARFPPPPPPVREVTSATDHALMAALLQRCEMAAWELLQLSHTKVLNYGTESQRWRVT